MFTLFGSLLWAAAITWVLVYSLTVQPVNSDDWFDMFDEDDYP